MRSLKKVLAAAAAASCMAMGVTAATGGPALAYVVCNNAGECWHTDHRYHYRPEWGLRWHPDDWYFHRHWDADHWRDYHEGRGYYRGGVWIPF